MDLYKTYLSEGTIKMNKTLNLFTQAKKIVSSKLSQNQIDQFHIYIDNLIKAFYEESESDCEFNLSKIYVEINDYFPSEYLYLFQENNIFELMVDILCKSSNIKNQLYSILILTVASYYQETAFFGVPYIIDQELFTRLITAPLNREVALEFDEPFIPKYYTKLLYNSFKYSNELSEAFYKSGLYQYFIDMCLNLDENDIKYITLWIDLINSLSSSNFLVSVEEKLQLIQISQIFYDHEYYECYLSSIDHLVDDASDELLFYIYQSDTFSQLINVLSKIIDKEAESAINNRKICMYSLYKMAFRAQNFECDLSQLPLDILSDLLEKVNISDQVCSLQLLLITLKNDNFLNYSIIDNFNEHGIYSTLVEINSNFKVETKYLMTEFFLLSLIKADPLQMEALFEYHVFEPVFNNIDCSNTDLLELFNCLMDKFLSNTEIITNFLLSDEISSLIFQLADEINEEDGELLFKVCDIINQCLEEQ